MFIAAAITGVVILGVGLWLRRAGRAPPQLVVEGEDLANWGQPTPPRGGEVP